MAHVQCPNCQQWLAAGVPQCPHCRATIPPAPGMAPPPPGGGDRAVQTLIPYRNVPALIGYYLGVFSLIPCLGPLLGIAAIVLGIIGLRKAGQDPDARGKGHGITAVVLGALSILGHLAFFLFMFASSRP